MKSVSFACEQSGDGEWGWGCPCVSGASAGFLKGMVDVGCNEEGAKGIALDFPLVLSAFCFAAVGDHRLREAACAYSGLF